MNKRDVFEHLMRNDPVFRKKVASKAGSFGMALFAAAKGCTSEVEQTEVGEMITGDQAKALNGKGAQLTEKEREVREAMLKTKNVDKVAKKLGTHPETIRYHIRHVFSKTGEDLMLLVGKKLRGNHEPQEAVDGAIRSSATTKKYVYEGTRQEALERNSKLRQAILTALSQGPASAAEIRSRIPKASRDKLILSKSMMGNAMTALKADKSIRRGKKDGNQTVWRLS